MFSKILYSQVMRKCKDKAKKNLWAQNFAGVKSEFAQV